MIKNILLVVKVKFNIDFIIKIYYNIDMEGEKKMIERLFKRANSLNQILMPRAVIRKMGKEFYMEIYKDKIVLVPVKK